MSKNHGCRSCGDCHACCVVLPIIELEKPRNIHCQHCTDRGCAIYDNGRPAVCKSWLCEWRNGNLPEWWHPTKSHMMFSVDPDADLDMDTGRITQNLDHKILRIYPLTATAMAENEHRLAGAIQRITQRYKGEIREVLWVPYDFKGWGRLGEFYKTVPDDKGRMWETVESVAV